MEQYVLDLPKQLEAYRAEFEKSVKPYVKIDAKKGRTFPWGSKFGGNPYIPIGFDYPKDQKGNPMFLLAQINFEEVPTMEPFPAKGILQFYISSNDDVYGLNFEDPTVQENYKVIYIPEVIKDEKEIISDFSFLPMPNEYSVPLTDECSLTFTLDYQPVATGDFQFRDFFGKDAIEFVDSVFETEEDAETFYNDFVFPGHRIGGYACFTQDDPREYNNDNHKILLLQIDTDGKNDIMWGDAGIGNFFIREEDLEKRDFSKVLYNWDCC